MRNRLGLTVRDVQFLSGVSAATVSRTENGGNTDVENVLEIAKALGLKVIFTLQPPVEP